MDAHGGWIASAVDLARFASALDRTGPAPMLKPETLALMTSHPEAPLWEGASSYYALGWRVRPAGESTSWWHTGSMPGTSAVLYRSSNGLIWAALFNTQPNTPGDEFLVDVISTMGLAASMDEILLGSLLVLALLVGGGSFLILRPRKGSAKSQTAGQHLVISRSHGAEAPSENGRSPQAAGGSSAG
jgi:hypothetical protein